MSERVSVLVHEGGSRVQLVILSTEKKKKKKKKKYIYIYIYIFQHPLFYLILEAVSMVTMMGRISMATIQFRIECLNRHKGDNKEREVLEQIVLLLLTVSLLHRVLEAPPI